MARPRKAAIVSSLAAIFLFAAVGLPVMAGDAKEEAVQKELEALKGIWAVVSAERDGKKLSDEQLKDVTLRYDGSGNVSVRKGEMLLFDGTIRIDPTKKPKTLDATQTSEGPDKGKTFLGIYELQGDTLKVCSAAPAGKDRPTEFSSRPGSGHFLRVYKRAGK
jgi:uncharacterized protein (TIGR03067 family)